MSRTGKVTPPRAPSLTQQSEGLLRPPQRRNQLLGTVCFSLPLLSKPLGFTARNGNFLQPRTGFYWGTLHTHPQNLMKARAASEDPVQEGQRHA